MWTVLYTQKVSIALIFVFLLKFSSTKYSRKSLIHFFLDFLCLLNILTMCLNRQNNVSKTIIFVQLVFCTILFYVLNIKKSSAPFLKLRSAQKQLKKNWLFKFFFKSWVIEETRIILIIFVNHPKDNRMEYFHAKNIFSIIWCCQVMKENLLGSTGSPLSKQRLVKSPVNRGLI